MVFQGQEKEDTCPKQSHRSVKSKDKALGPSLSYGLDIPISSYLLDQLQRQQQRIQLWKNDLADGL